MDLLTLTTSRAYFYPGAPEMLSERKFADFGRKNDRRRGFSLTTAAGSHRQQKGRQPGTHGGTLWGWRPASVGNAFRFIEILFCFVEICFVITKRITG